MNKFYKSLCIVLALCSMMLSQVFALKVVPISIDESNDTSVSIVNSSNELKSINDFTDIDETNPYFNAFRYLVERGVVKGVTQDKISPETGLNRSQFIVMLSRLIEGRSLEISESPYFKDVNYMHWFAGAVEWGLHHKVTNGIGNDCFGPNISVTKEQMVTMIYNYVQNNDVKFRQVEIKDDPIKDMESVSEWGYEAISWANVMGMLEKDEMGNFNPSSNATRQDMAQLLYNFDLLRIKD